MSPAFDPFAVPTRRPRCRGCGLPLATCLCALVVRIDNPVDVLVLQHPSEADEAKGTVRLLSRCLARCRVVVGEAFDPVDLAGWLREEGRQSVLLYPPDEGSTSPAVPRIEPTALRLVVLDGTWRKTMRMLKASTLLQRLPRLALVPVSPGAYAALRRARLTTQSSSLEAACAALTLLESDPERYEPVRGALMRFVEAGVSRIPAGSRRRP